MAFKIEDKTISIKKDCKQCISLKVCKFHTKMHELCKTNEFYSMTYYSESNNSLEVFELHARCQYFKLKYIIPEDGSINFDIDENIIRKIVDIELRKKYDLSTSSIDFKKQEVTIRTKGAQEEKKITIVELIKGYKFK